MSNKLYWAIHWSNLLYWKIITLKKQVYSEYTIQNNTNGSWLKNSCQFESNSIDPIKMAVEIENKSVELVKHHSFLFIWRRRMLCRRLKLCTQWLDALNPWIWNSSAFSKAQRTKSVSWIRCCSLWLSRSCSRTYRSISASLSCLDPPENRNKIVEWHWTSEYDRHVC